MKKNFYISFLTLLMLCVSTFAAKKEVVFVRGAGNYNDSLTIAAIANYAGGSVYNVTELLKSAIEQSDLAQLNAADVVIMGRNCSSWDIAGAMGVWDSITCPVISMNMWGLRNSRAKWMDDGTVNFGGAAGDTLTGVIVASDDAVFDGISSDTVDWWFDRYNVFSIKNGGNGEVLAQTLDSVPLFVRWEAGVEFYPGAGHFPLAERVFIGCGDDGSGVNYFGFSDAGKEVFFNELLRVGSITDVEIPIGKISSLSALSMSVGTLAPSFSGITYEYVVTVPYGTADVPTATATPTDPRAEVEIEVAASFDDTTIITVTAEDTTIQSVYEISFAVTPASSDATLSYLGLNAGTLDPEFSAEVTDYTVTFPAGTEDVPTVTATAANEFATVDIVDATSFDEDATITVTAQDGSTLVYTINYELAEGLDNPNISNIKIYPNPAASVVQISGVNVEYVELFNISGNIINKYESHILNISELSNGVYVLKVYTTDNVYITRFIKN